MKLSLIIFVTSLTLTFASSLPEIQATSIIDYISQLLFIYLNPIFQNTFKQLTQLVFVFGERLSQTSQHGLARLDRTQPAPWVSQLFSGVNSISSQWNNHIIDFFANIPTIFENNGRNLMNFSAIKQILYETVENLLGELKKLYLNKINALMISIFADVNLLESMGRKRATFYIDELLNGFQQQVSDIFNKTKEQLNHNIDDSIDFVITYWNHIKDRFLGYILNH
ncbi:unnamed protein product [Rotaria magnacalcarata]|nr:unnamed protein product [Rotaria magnacalcarata]CAF1549136.1 unnamed protein product [Rotaria magnacalcarata]CAF1918464.1 unnamed protein product [Rotaria magnacalcarata]CAF3783430.1 unnamed protein product [Rotaria magnacalcarata]CAF3840786.1 unnamed protein product [Rotaria magnacalcarata]